MSYSPATDGSIRVVTASGGIPLPLLQVPVLAAAMDFAAPGFTGGFVADSLFSLPRGKRQAVRGGENPELFGPETFSVSSERALLEGLFGKEAVAARIRERDEYVLSRVECPQRLSPLNRGCLASFFCSSAPVYRQLALARNKSLYNSYAARPLVEKALSLPVPGRLFRDGTFKPVLKGILSRHLPPFPVDEEKGGTGLPRTRFCRQGPLRGYFGENPLPEAFEMNAAQNAKLDAYLAKRFQGDFTMAGIKFWADMKGLDGAFLQKALPCFILSIL